MSTTQGALAQSPKQEAHDKVLENNPDGIGIWKCWFSTVAHNCHIKNKFPTSKSNLPHQTQIRHNKSKIVAAKANSPHQNLICHIKNELVTAKTNGIQYFQERQNTEHWNTGTSRNITEHPKKTRNTFQKTRNTSECVCKILRIPPRIEVRNQPLMKRQKPRKVILILQSHKLENSYKSFTFTYFNFFAGIFI